MTEQTTFYFPKGDELSQLLKLGQNANLEDLFAKALTGPIESLLSRPRKNLRCQLVDLGFRIAKLQDTDGLELSCKMIEVLHAGSLVVDDIEDESEERRGQPSLHKVVGLPIALNAANWLYFLPFQYIDQLQVSESIKASLHRECANTLLRAHYGQALDVGISLSSLPQDRVHEVSLSSIELKTGVLAGFSMKLGSLLAGRDLDFIQKVDCAGRKLGVALQMFDDIGNLTSSHNPSKRLEDLLLGRISFVAATAAQTLSAKDYAEFLTLPGKIKSDPDQLHTWLQERGVLAAAKQQAQAYLDQAIRDIELNFELEFSERKMLQALRHYLMESYG